MFKVSGPPPPPPLSSASFPMFKSRPKSCWLSYVLTAYHTSEVIMLVLILEVIELFEPWLHTV